MTTKPNLSHREALIFAMGRAASVVPYEKIEKAMKALNWQWGSRGLVSEESVPDVWDLRDAVHKMNMSLFEFLSATKKTSAGGQWSGGFGWRYELEMEQEGDAFLDDEEKAPQIYFSITWGFDTGDIDGVSFKTNDTPKQPSIGEEVV